MARVLRPRPNQQRQPPRNRPAPKVVLRPQRLQRPDPPVLNPVQNQGPLVDQPNAILVPRAAVATPRMDRTPGSTSSNTALLTPHRNYYNASN